MNNFSKDAVDDTNANSNLEQARDAIFECKSSLDRIIKMLVPESTKIERD